MKDTLISILLFITLLPIIAIYFAYWLYRIKKAPSLETAEEILRRASWGNRGTLPSTLEPHPNLEQDLTIPKPTQRNIVRNHERHRIPAELLRFQPNSFECISFTHNPLTPLSKNLIRPYSPPLPSIDTKENS